MRKILFIVLLIFSPVRCWSGGVAPASEPTQILNLGTLTEIVNTAHKHLDKLDKIVNLNMEMVKDYLDQAKIVPEALWEDTVNAIGGITSTVDRTRGIWESAQSIEGRFKEQFRGYEYWLKNEMNMVNFSNQYSNWEQQSKDATKVLMEGSSLSFMTKDEKKEHVKKIKKIGETHTGRNAILQTSNMLEQCQIENLNELNSLISKQMGAQATFKLKEIEQEGMSGANTEKIYSGFKKNKTIVGDGFKLMDTLK